VVYLSSIMHLFYLLCVWGKGRLRGDSLSLCGTLCMYRSLYVYRRL